MFVFLYLHNLCFSALLGELVLLFCSFLSFYFCVFGFIFLKDKLVDIFPKKGWHMNMYNVEDHNNRMHLFTSLEFVCNCWITLMILQAFNLFLFPSCWVVVISYFIILLWINQTQKSNQLSMMICFRNNFKILERGLNVHFV